MKKFFVVLLTLTTTVIAQGFTFRDLTPEEKRVYAAQLIQKGQVIRESLKGARDSAANDTSLESELTDATELTDIAKAKVIRIREFTRRTNVDGLRGVTPRTVHQKTLDDGVVEATRIRDEKQAVLNELPVDTEQVVVDAATADVAAAQSVLGSAIAVANAFREN